MARPIKQVKLGDYFTLKGIQYSQIQKGMIINFGYTGVNAHDKTPMVYVLEVRKDRVYGFNLRYKPTLFNDIRKAKQSSIGNLIRSKLAELATKGVSPEVLADPKLRDTILQDLPTQYLEYYEINIKSNAEKYMLRNYLPDKISNLKYIIFKPTTAD